MHTEYRKGTFGFDLQFLKQYHKDLILLGDGADAGAQIIIIPAYHDKYNRWKRGNEFWMDKL
jgi:hypothetical protein